MKVTWQQEVLDLLKQRMLPELGELRQRVEGLSGQIAAVDAGSKERDLQLLEAIRQVDIGARERDERLASGMAVLQADVKVLTGRVDALEKRMEERFGDVDRRLQEIDKRFEQLEKRIDEVQQAVRDVWADVREVRTYVFGSGLALKQLVREQEERYK